MTPIEMHYSGIGFVYQAMAWLGLYTRELPVARLGNSYAIGVENLRKWSDSKKKLL